ncbi:hypothetical protein [Antribacter gilvus]|uniref:hypothetical protein n=1 Tax=Antribacter gilvus TaxID=2304675 RepID=UPI000F7B7293|nr:hypothetical protein [Antribacter gilvus]
MRYKIPEALSLSRQMFNPVDRDMAYPKSVRIAGSSFDWQQYAVSGERAVSAVLLRKVITTRTYYAEPCGLTFAGSAFIAGQISYERKAVERADRILRESGWLRDLEVRVGRARLYMLDIPHTD